MQTDLKEMEIENFRSLIKTDSEFTIISSNCIGGVIYSDLHRKFLSPTINLFFSAKDFLKFVFNLDYYLSMKPKFSIIDETITAVLDDITIYFLHYDSLQQAEEKWNERKTRIIKDKYFIICTDRDGFDQECYELFKKITYPKILITCNELWKDDPNVLYLEQYAHQKQVDNTISKREFYKDNLIANIINNNF